MQHMLYFRSEIEKDGDSDEVTKATDSFEII